VSERKRKFGALADLHRQSEELPPVTSPAASEEVMPEPGRGRGRPATGKRSNPEWKLYSHFLKRETQKAAVTRLLAENSERDLSDVLEELLQEWLKR
jgi:hypothetical protein